MTAPVRGPLDLTGDIIAFEAGELEMDEVVELFQQLVNTGMIHHLQGSYQRMAGALYSSGHIQYPSNGGVA